MTSFPRVQTSMNLNDLEPQNRGVSEFSSRFEATTYISRVNCVEITGDRLGQPANEIFSITQRF